MDGYTRVSPLEAKRAERERIARQLLLQGVPSRQIALQLGCSREAVERAGRRITEIRERFASAV